MARQREDLAGTAEPDDLRFRSFHFLARRALAGTRYDAATTGFFHHGRIQEEWWNMPALNIKDPDVHALAAELARRTGRSLTESVKTALEESLRRQRSTQKDSRKLVERVMQIGRRASSRPMLDRRSPEEILGYDKFGIPR